MLAWAVPFSVLPSALWRLAALAGISGAGHPVTRAIRPDAGYVVALSVGSVLAAFLTLGLVQTWGATWPSWIPKLGRRPVRAWVVLSPASVGSILATVAAAYALINLVPPSTRSGRGMPLEGSELALVDLVYSPLLLAGAMLGVVTLDHLWRRRREKRPAASGAAADRQTPRA